MKADTKTYVRFVGTYRQMSAPKTTVEVTSRDVAGLDIPAGTLEFTFFDKRTVTFDDGRTFEQESNVSPPFKLQPDTQRLGRRPDRISPVR